MRTIKFRVWRYCHREKKFKYYYLDYLRIVTNGGADIVFQERNCEYFDDSVQPLNEKEVVEQFTGLTDKNGREIYEGDILHGAINAIRNARMVVKWEDILDNEWGERAGVGFPFETPKSEDWEIIGNIHENPKLLK